MTTTTYQTGTVSVNNGSNVVTPGDGAVFAGNVAAGGIFSLVADDVPYTVSGVDGSGDITLTEAFGGESGTGLAYQVTMDFVGDVPLPRRGDIAPFGTIAEGFKRLYARAGRSVAIDATGLFAQRYIYDAEAAGFLFLATDTGMLYARQSAVAGVWSAAMPFGKGDKGDKGDSGPIGASFNPDATGLFSERSTFNSQAAGFAFLATDTAMLYFRQTATAGVWSVGVPFGKGDKGDKGDQGVQGVKGDQGIQGVKGDTGSPGVGVPAGGATGQVLAKKSATNYDSEWIAPPSTGRELLTANRTYYVRTNGSDSNNGLANTSGGAFLTIQKAIDVAASLDLGIYNVTISVADGTYSQALNLKTTVGAGSVALVGNNTTWSNVKLNNAGSGNQFTLNVPGNWSISGFQLDKTGGSGSAIVANGSGASIIVDKVIFGTGWRYHFYCSFYGKINASSRSYSVADGETCHYVCDGGYLEISNATVTFLANVTFSLSFAYSDNTGLLRGNPPTFNLGAFTVTGRRYRANGNSVMNTFGGGPNVFPGTIAGDFSTGGQYI